MGQKSKRRKEKKSKRIRLGKEDWRLLKNRSGAGFHGGRKNKEEDLDEWSYLLYDWD